MEKIKVYFLSLLSDTPKRGFWDYGLLEDLLSDFEKWEVDHLPKTEFGIVVIPARSHYKIIDYINSELAKINNVLLFLMGDEEHVFPVEKINHPNIKIWVQNPKQGRHDKYGKLGTGYPQAIRKYKDQSKFHIKTIDSFFAGQITHDRRFQMVANFDERIPNGVLIKTIGFTKGLSQAEYYDQMGYAKTVPAPSGPETVDTFRVFEALELGAVPIADSKTPKEDMKGFWEWLFNCPVRFPIVSEWEQLPGYTKDSIEKYPALNNRVQAWWMQVKHNLRESIRDDLEYIGYKVDKSPITVIVPISPIPSHPKTDILTETINSIRYHLPEARIVLAFDGLRKEQESMREKYEEHISSLLWDVSKMKNGQWDNIFPIIFDTHLHQSGMLRVIVDIINTPLLLFVEQDTPLVTDEPINWELIESAITSGAANVIRLYHEGKIPKEHDSLMLGEPKNSLLKTVQWSQRPHVASTAFYKHMITEHFSEESRCFIEDKIYGKVMADYQKYGQQGWNQWRICLYYPSEKNSKRSYHLDGRQGSEKFDDKQIW